MKNENILTTNHHFYLRFSKEINAIFQNKHFLIFSNISTISDIFDQKYRKYSKIPRPDISEKCNLTRPGFPYVFDHFPIFLVENIRYIWKNENILITNLHFYLRCSKEINAIFQNKHFLTFSDISMISDKFDQKWKNPSLSIPTRFLHKIVHFLENMIYC